jgi:hypothetical protein
VGVSASLGFDDALAREGSAAPACEPRTLQVNVGKRCNQACHHCHVDAGPKRTEIMTRRPPSACSRSWSGTRASRRWTSPAARPS